MTIKNKVLLGAFIASLTGTFAIAVGQGVWGVSRLSRETQATDSPYTIVLNSSNVPSQLTSSYQSNISTTIKTPLNNYINVNIVNGKTASNKFVELASRGMIYNFDYRGSGFNEIKGIQSVTAIFSGSLKIKTGQFGQPGGVELNDGYALTSGTPRSVDYSKYFQFIAGDAGAVIESISITYSCEDGYAVSKLNGSYTGIGSDNYTYQLTFNNGNVNYKTLNKLNETNLNGTVALSSATAGTCTFGSQTYSFNLSEDGYQLTNTGVSGADMQAINFNRVYEVENFESYSSTGTGWDSSHAGAQYTASGMRAHYLADFYNSTSSYIQSPLGSDWRLMGTTNYNVFSSNKGRNESKAGAFKGNPNKLRYVSMNSVYGVAQAIGKGTTMSFFAKGAYTSDTLETQSTANAKLKLYAFYSYNGVNSRTEYEFTIPAGSKWTEYTMGLDSSKIYYGFGFYCENSATTYTLVDDIKIYTHSPNVVPPINYPTGTFVIEKSVRPLITTFNVAIAISIGTEENHLVAMSVGNHDAEPSNFTYDKSQNKFSMSTSAQVEINNSNYSVGTVTGTYDMQNRRLTDVTCSGSIKGIMQGGTSMTLTTPSNVWDCDEDTGTLQNIFRRRWSPYSTGGGWQADNDHTDRITSDKNTFVSGEGAVKLRGYADGAAALNLKADLNPAASCKNISWWVYNPGTTDVTMTCWVYSGTNFDSNYQFVTRTVSPGWHYYCDGCSVKSGSNYNPRTVYNFQFMVSQTSTYFIFDNIILF